jgi:signal transduction histidine kinase
MSAPADRNPPARPVLMRLLVREFEYRRPRLYGGVRIGSGIFNVVLGVALLASVHWAGPLAWLGALPLAGAALIFWTVHRLQQDSVRRVRQLEQSRTRLVDDSTARLREIERDLHDGAQAQMVAVTMKLGLAVKKLGGMTDGAGQTDLDRVLELVAAAHRGAKEAIAELRDLCRGIHPPVLDQGLGIALTTLAARSDLPVEMVIDLPERPSAAIETIAYFCAAELLTNVTKHSGARACAPRSLSAATTPRPECSCSPSTSRPGTRPTCSARRLVAVPQGSGTCSRTGSATSRNSSRR